MKKALYTDGYKIYTVDDEYVCQIAPHIDTLIYEDFEDITVHNQKTLVESRRRCEHELEKLERWRVKTARELVDCFNLVYFPDQVGE